MYWKFWYKSEGEKLVALRKKWSEYKDWVITFFMKIKFMVQKPFSSMVNSFGRRDSIVIMSWNKYVPRFID